MIPYRPILSIIAALAAILFTLRLAWIEMYSGEDGPSIPPTEAMAGSVSKNRDPMIDIQWTDTDRESNLRAFGFDDAMVKDAVAKMVDYDRNSRPRIDELIEGAPDIDQLHKAFCSQNNNNRPRYEAIHFLVDEESGGRRAIELESTSSLNAQEWAIVAPINAIHQKLELEPGPDRKEDATVMGVAAILLGQEELALDGDRPWGRGSRKWSWEEINEKWSYADARVVEYFALMHVFAESMWREGGLCNQ